MAVPQLNMVVSTIKACVISNPDGVDEDRLNSEFRQLMGTVIPWRDLGFKSLHDLIKSSPNLKVVNKGGRRIVVAEAASVEHLSALIKSQKRAAPKKQPQRFPQKNITYKSNSVVSRGGANSKPFSKKVSLKRVDFVERNNNVPSKPPIHKESHYPHYRPAGDSSSSCSDSPTFTFAATDSKPTHPAPKQKCKNPKRDDQKKLTENSISKTDPKSPAPVKKAVQQNSVKKSEKLVSGEVKSVETSKPKKLDIPKPKASKTSQAAGAKSPPQPLIPQLISPSTGLFPSTIPLNVTSPVFQPPALPVSNILTHPSQHIMNMSIPDLIPTEPVIYISPSNLQNAYIPVNLVPPKPMKPGSYRGGRRKFSARSKLMSIKDNSTPGEDSLTAKFINLIKGQDWPEPEYRLLPRIGPNKVEVYGCTVRGSYSLDDNETLLTYDYSTIPDEFSDKNASKEAVSQKAFEDISSKIREARNYIPVTSNIHEIIERLFNMVTVFPNGLWAYKVESDYKTKYNERLPSNWVNLISETNILVAEKLADFSYVIRPVTKTNTEVEAGETPLAELEYPETETWDVYITKIVSSSEVWFRFVGPKYSDCLDEVTKEMCEYYQDWTLFICPSPVVGSVYIYPSIYGAVRVKVISLDTPNMATVLHIDHGDIEEIPRDQICVLDPRFHNIPPQAVCCKMYDLEEYCDSKLCTAFLMDKVEGRVLVAQIMQTEPLVLDLFDTSLDNPINLNQEVAKQLKTNITTPPSFSQDLAVHEGIITSIWKMGDIWLQLPYNNDGLTHLSIDLESLQETPPDSYLTHPEDVFPDVLYLVEVNGKWLRARVLPPARPINSKVELLLIDTGDIQTSYFTDLVPLFLCSMVLCEIPNQAVHVRLSNVNIYEKTVDKLMSLLSPPCKALVKVVSLGQVPEVELYIRESKGLISINETLCIEENLSKNISNISFTSSCTDYTTIKQATTPECTKFFDVYVVSVSNPSNFTVIPREYMNSLTKLQNRLQECYKSVDPSFFKLKNFTVGQACAVLHSDGQWYRGLIEQHIDRSMSQMMIRFCDFGNLAMISADRLLALDRSFLNLPAVGFNASIADIQPITVDWEFVDCLRTQKLMLEKNLVTLIKSKTENQGQVFLKLQVFDTTGEMDCDIGNILVDESRAKYIS